VNTKSIYVWCFLLLLSLPVSSWAKIELHEFENKQQEALYNKMIEELRCLVCQNQNLADSNAELAIDLREKTYKMVVQNKSETDIVDYMVNRYGDFVLYKPPFKINTLLLWIGPFFLLVLAIYFALKIVRQSAIKPQSETAQVKAEHESIRKLLEQEDKK